MKILSLITLISFQTKMCKIFVHLWTQIKIYLMKIRELSDPPLTANQLICSRPRNIVETSIKIFLVTINGSTLILWSSETTFVCKENKNKDFIQQISSLPCQFLTPYTFLVLEHVLRCVYGGPESSQIHNMKIVMNCHEIALENRDCTIL